MKVICSSMLALVGPSVLALTLPSSLAPSAMPFEVALKYPMPISLGTSTTLIFLPLRLGGLVGEPPSYGFADALAGVASQASGLVGRSSPPVQPAAMAGLIASETVTAIANAARSMMGHSLSGT